MPWDNDNDDNDSDWSDKYLESRLRFFYDLQKGIISRSLGHHIRMLLTEARYIQQRRDYLEHGIDDNEDDLNKSMRNFNIIKYPKKTSTVTLNETILQSKTKLPILCICIGAWPPFVMKSKYWRILKCEKSAKKINRNR